MKRETWQVVAYITGFYNTLFNFVMSYFWVGGNPKCNLQFVTPVGMMLASFSYKKLHPTTKENRVKRWQSFYIFVVLSFRMLA